MTRPRISVEDIDTAIMWLLTNEGGNGEADACNRVAEWLLAEMKERGARMIMRDHGCSLAVAKRAFAKMEEEEARS